MDFECKEGDRFEECLASFDVDCGVVGGIGVVIDDVTEEIIVMSLG
jgi:hypothetical protein